MQTLDFKLGDIDWENNSIKQSSSKPALSQQLLDITNNRFLNQHVEDPTRITEHSSNTLDLFFSNNSKTEVIPGISDHEAVYVEACLRPTRIPTVKRNVFSYKKANYKGLREELRKLYTEMSTMQQASTETLWLKFKDTMNTLLKTFIPSKTI